MPEIKTASHEKHYEAAQAAQEEFFVATNKINDDFIKLWKKLILGKQQNDVAFNKY